MNGSNTGCYLRCCIEDNALEAQVHQPGHVLNTTQAANGRHLAGDYSQASSSSEPRKTGGALDVVDEE